MTWKKYDCKFYFLTYGIANVVVVTLSNPETPICFPARIQLHICVWTKLLKYIDGDFNDSSNKIYVLAIYFYNEFGWFKGSITFICDSWIYLEHKTGKMIKIFLLYHVLWGLQVSTNTYSLIIFDKLDKQVVNYGAGFYNFQIIMAVITIRAMLYDLQDYI